jgi:hypothetical protein
MFEFLIQDLSLLGSKLAFLDKFIDEVFALLRAGGDGADACQKDLSDCLCEI